MTGVLQLALCASPADPISRPSLRLPIPFLAVDPEQVAASWEKPGMLSRQKCKLSLAHNLLALKLTA